LLEEIAENNYRVPSAPSPPPWALGAALADYWHAHFSDRLTVNLEDLSQGDFASVFLLGEEGLTQIFLQLKQEGMIDLYRISRPYQIVLLQPSSEFALERLYV
jgi:hypothetical protein